MGEHNLTEVFFCICILKLYGRSHSRVFPLTISFLQLLSYQIPSASHHEVDFILNDCDITRYQELHFKKSVNLKRKLTKPENKQTNKHPPKNPTKEPQQSTYWDTGSFQNGWRWQSLWFWLVPVSSIIYSFCGRLKTKIKVIFFSKSTRSRYILQKYCSSNVAK